MTAIARGSLTEPHKLGPFIDREKRVARRSSPAPDRGPYRRTLPRRAAFWLLAAVLCLLFVATAAPAPLYGVYQAEWHFSVRVQVTALTASAASAAVSVSFTTSAGWETIAKWPEGTSTVVAPMRLANIRSASAGSA